jgi:hypothetical protein
LAVRFGIASDNFGLTAYFKTQRRLEYGVQLIPAAVRSLARRPFGRLRPLLGVPFLVNSFGATMHFVKMLFMMFSAAAIIGDIHGQEVTTNPPYPSQNPYAPRGNPASPNGRYAWVVATSDTVAYQLIDSSNGRALATLKSYFPDSGGSEAIRYAKAFGVYWNADSNLVALDELNYRRAGYLYFFSIRDGVVKKIEMKPPKPLDADEARLCADKGWISPLRFSVRQAVKLTSGNFKSDYYSIDFEDLDHPKIQPVLH